MAADRMRASQSPTEVMTTDHVENGQPERARMATMARLAQAIRRPSYREHVKHEMVLVGFRTTACCDVSLLKNFSY